MVKLKEKIQRFKVKYDVILEKENEINKPVIQISKHAFVHKHDYIWVVFKHNQTQKQVGKLFEKEHPVATLFKTLLCITDDQPSLAAFESQELIIEEQPLEPDQIIWNNLKYTK